MTKTLTLPVLSRHNLFHSLSVLQNCLHKIRKLLILLYKFPGHSFFKTRMFKRILFGAFLFVIPAVLFLKELAEKGGQNCKKPRLSEKTPDINSHDEEQQKIYKKQQQEGKQPLNKDQQDNLNFNPPVFRSIQSNEDLGNISMIKQATTKQLTDDVETDPILEQHKDGLERKRDNLFFAMISQYQGSRSKFEDEEESEFQEYFDNKSINAES